MTQRVLIIAHYCSNGESLIVTICIMRPIFGRSNLTDTSTVKRIIGKLERTILLARCRTRDTSS